MAVFNKLIIIKFYDRLFVLMAIPPSKRLSNSTETTLSEVETTRPWSDLPRDLLSPIANRLGLIELLGFRGACKDWKAASSTASAKTESSSDHRPWFILYGENSECILYDQLDKKKYTINVPELDGATCLASNQGWLLLSREGSIFFFCPFSRARIELPSFPHSDLSGHNAALSAPPTSENCVVCVINRHDHLIVELNVLRRGEQTWTKVNYDCPENVLGVVTGTTYHEGTFYFLDNRSKLLTYAVKKKKWVLYTIVDSSSASTNDCLPFAYRTNYFRNWDMKRCLELGEDVSVSTCGTGVRSFGGEYDMVINNESIAAVSKEIESPRQLKGIWIESRFLQIPPNQS
ncbi:unnamed protein product [Camellia sinensis]